MRKTRKQKRFGFLIGFIAVVGLGVLILILPPVWARVSYHVEELYTTIKYKLNPPQEAVFVPGQGANPTVAAMVQQTLAAINTATPNAPTATEAATPEPTATQVPLPSPVLLKGIKEEKQEMNNCAPTTLSMYLSFWHWVGSQDDIAPVVKPYKEDKNVMAYELVDYVNEKTQFKALTRIGGDLYTIKSLINAGIPVMVEKGFYVPTLNPNHLMGWMGHYELVNGYDDQKGIFYTHDSYLPLVVGTEEAKGLNFTYNNINHNFEIPYGDFYADWRAFDYTFIVVYPPERENDVVNLLGPLWDENNAFIIARDRAKQEISALSDPYQQYFAWYNLGTSDVKLQNYAEAATAFDKAFLLVPGIDSDHRPYRNIWYQTGPYFAYYNTGRYQDIIDLATNTLDNMAQPILEESYYWRAMAEVQIGHVNDAIADLKKALEYHEGFAPAVDELKALGVTP